MRILKVPQTGAKRKLLDAAEGLVVEKGFDLVSVRDITGSVKANVAAVNYHFGSREGLMDLVMMRSLEPLCDARLSALRNAQETSPSAEQIVSAYVGTFFTTARSLEMEQSLFLRISGRILVLPDSALSPSLSFSRREVREKYLEALGIALPGTDSKEISHAWDFFEAGIAQSLLSEKPMPDDWIAIGVRCLTGSYNRAIATQAGAEPAKEIEPEMAEPAPIEEEEIETTPPEAGSIEDKVVAFQDAEASAADEKIVDISEPGEPEKDPEPDKPGKSKKPKGKKADKDDSQEMLFDF